MRAAATAAAVALLLVPCMGAGPGTAMADLVLQGDLGSLAASGVAVRLAGDVHLSAGAAVALAQATMQAPAPVRIEVADGAVLSLSGVRLRDGQVTLWVGPGGRLEVDGSDLRGADVAVAGGQARLQDTDLQTGGGGVRLDGGMLEITGGAVSGPAAPLLLASAGDLQVRGANVGASLGHGVLVRTGATLSMVDAVIAGSGGYGVFLDGGAARIEATRFQRTGDYGLRATNGTLDMRDGEFGTHCGAFLDGRALDASFTGVRFATDGHGVTAWEAGRVTLRENEFAGTREGARLSFSGAVVEDNRFDRNGVGLVVEASSLRVEGNVFAGNEGGVQVLGAGGPSDVELGPNIFQGNGYDVQGLAA